MTHILIYFYRVVEFASYSDMKAALDKLDDTDLNGRRVRLVEDRGRGRGSRKSRSSSRSRSRSRSRRRDSRSRSRYNLRNILDENLSYTRNVGQNLQ